MGLVPAGTWGDGVTGRSWSGVMALRRAARAALVPHAARRSLAIDLALVPGDTTAVDPAYLCTVNPIMMLAQAFWDSWMPREILCRMLLNADKSLREARTPWSKVVGPVSAALRVSGS
eukprot:759186-Pyramimonas_sp.AAC.1